MFRFTIRDVLWLMVVVGALLALWQERIKHNSDLARLNDVSREHDLLKRRLKDGGYGWTSTGGGDWKLVTPYDSN